MEDSADKTTIRSFQDLKVYQSLYSSMLIIHKQIVPNLPVEEKFDLCQQMRRASKGACALLAEGFAKRYKEKHWKKYLEDSQGECNEMINHISMCIDLYPQHIDTTISKELIKTYDIACRQLTKIQKVWKNYQASA